MYLPALSLDVGMHPDQRPVLRLQSPRARLDWVGTERLTIVLADPARPAKDEQIA
jgi:hypothetical protein